MIDNETLITVRDNIVTSGLTVFLRQAIITAAGYAFGDAIAGSAWPEAGAALVVLLATYGYGQLKNYRDKKDAIALAESAPIGVVVK